MPAARSIQEFVYHILGKEFFTYAVLLVILSSLCIIIYFFLFRLRVKSISQYVWLLLCSSIYIFFTIQLGGHNPEEAVHLLEYGLLAYFVFRALSHRIRDWTVYVTGVMFVVLTGIADEFVQWLLPDRVWDYKDVGINALAGAVFMIAVSRGVRPEMIRESVNTFSVRMLFGSITAVLVFLAVCLSNTPENVDRYTSVLDGLSWLRKEEAMSNLTAASLSTVDVWLALFLLLILLWSLGKQWEKRLGT